MIVYNYTCLILKTKNQYSGQKVKQNDLEDDVIITNIITLRKAQWVPLDAYVNSPHTTFGDISVKESEIITCDEPPSSKSIKYNNWQFIFVTNMSSYSTRFVM